jgi:hypothetical protein
MSSTSVIRRYTPPTCTLEIAANDSPLSRWMGQSVLKHVRFKLSFDDPRIANDQWTVVRGNRAQLEALTQAVTGYVQQFLSQSATYLSRPNAPAAIAEPTTEIVTETNPAGIYLQPKGLVSHELHLGTLANESSGSSIRLSAVQLSDLATALDEFAAEATTLPNLENPRWISTPPAWGTIAAAVVVAIGVTATIARVFEPSPQVANNSAPAPSSSDQRLAVQPLPNSPPPSPLASLPASPLPLASVPATPPTNPPIPKNLSSPSPAVPTQPQQMAKVEVPKQPPVDAPTPQIQVPVREVPVSAIPDQTLSSKKPSGSAKIGNPSATNSAADPIPPAAIGAPTPSTGIASGDVQISSSADQSATATLRAPSSAETLAARSAAAPVIPQVAEAKAFFQGRWQPPKELNQSIEYRLVLSPDGTIREITPLGDTANRFVDRTPIPLIGDKFVSPIRGGGSPTIRLILSPSGEVQTFSESQ